MPVSGDAGRREPRLPRAGAPYLFPIALTLLVGLAVWAGWDRLAALGTVLESPEAQVRRALARQDRADLEDVYGFRAGGTVRLHRLRFADVTVSAEGDRAEVVAVLEAEGRVAWRDEAATVAYVGRERFGMSPCRIWVWCADGRQFASLRGVLTALFRRQDAFNGRDPEAYGRLVSDRYQGEGGRQALLAQLRADLGKGPPARMRVVGWQVRVEQDRALVGEDYTIEVGDAPPRTLRARFEMAREGERWAIVSGL
ncbi:MAG TPA: nuclear transport factor 2 family protein [Anaeromyxobacteraceae bacterium]|nr:nuclear transport factor 2 family protein [Anaeromyxobacteraceae bacterium]